VGGGFACGLGENGLFNLCMRYLLQVFLTLDLEHENELFSEYAAVSMIHAVGLCVQ
jgi:hypothetical protein